MGNDEKLFKEIVRQLAEITADHEKRLRWLERGAAMMMGAILLIQFVLKP